MKKRVIIACVLAAAMLFGTVMIPDLRGELPEDHLHENIVQVNEKEKLAEQATVFQTMHFRRCNHQVERRVEIPSGLIGADFEQAAAYYELWHIQEMTQEIIRMERYIDLYCPAHVVLSLDPSGQVVLAENRYGDGMAIVKTIDTKQPAEDKRKMLIAGIGFDGEEDALQWMRDVNLLP